MQVFSCQIQVHPKFCKCIVLNIKNSMLYNLPISDGLKTLRGIQHTNYLSQNRESASEFSLATKKSQITSNNQVQFLDK